MQRKYVMTILFKSGRRFVLVCKTFEVALGKEGNGITKFRVTSNTGGQFLPVISEIEAVHTRRKGFFEIVRTGFRR